MIYIKKDKLITLNIVALLGLGTVGATNEVTNVTAQAKTTHVAKKTHKKHATKKATKKLTKFDKEELKWRKQLAKGDNDTTSTDTYNTNDTQPSKIVDGYDETNQKIANMSDFINALTTISFNKMNAYRQSKGLQPLTEDTNLTKIAQIRAQQEANVSWTAGVQGHYASDGELLCNQVAQQLGLNIQPSAENAGKFSMDGLDHTYEIGNASVQQAIDEGPNGGHYENAFNADYTKCGIGFYVQTNGDVGYVLELQ